MESSPAAGHEIRESDPQCVPSNRHSHALPHHDHRGALHQKESTDPSTQPEYPRPRYSSYTSQMKFVPSPPTARENPELPPRRAQSANPVSTSLSRAPTGRRALSPGRRSSPSVPPAAPSALPSVPAHQRRSPPLRAARYHPPAPSAPPHPPIPRKAT